MRPRLFLVHAAHDKIEQFNIQIGYIIKIGGFGVVHINIMLQVTDKHQAKTSRTNLNLKLLKSFSIQFNILLF